MRGRMNAKTATITATVPAPPSSRLWVVVKRRRDRLVSSDIRGNLSRVRIETGRSCEMKIHRSFSIEPGTALALVALFFALGGSAFAVGERVQSATAAQQRCTNGAVRGVATVSGTSAGMANIPDQFTSTGALFSRKFNCSGKAVQVR